MDERELFERYQDLQAYVDWTSDDAARIQRARRLIQPRIHLLVDDFYEEIEKHPAAARVITGGAAQVERLKASLSAWLSESLEGRSDADYVARRWRIGRKHAEIGLNSAYVSAAMSRLRNGLLDILADAQLARPNARQSQPRTLSGQFCASVKSINKLLALELAVIQDAYEAEHLKRERLAEQERSEVNFRRLIEAAACMVVILRPDHSIAYFSPYSEALTGYAAAAVTGQDFVMLFIPESTRATIMMHLEATLTGRPTKAYEMPILRRDGTQRWLVWNTQRLEDLDGGAAVLAVGQDVTERRDAQERLLRSERLAGIGQMITGLAHESRNALQRIQACGEMLELEVEGNEEAMRFVRRSQEAQDHLRRLFDEVRGYAAPIQLEHTLCRLDAVWREAWNLLEANRQGRSASLVESTDGADLTVSGDRFRFVQLFRNLFENSLAACTDPAIIQICSRNVQFQQQDALEIRFQDNGPGLSPEARQYVFEPFFTTKMKGTGLGMAIARRIVEAHGGEIAVGDVREAGAEFVVTLPRTIR